MRGRIIRDIKARRAVAKMEMPRTIWRYLARNTTLEPQIRMQAQLALSRVPREASPSAIKN
ncbi:40S ribosomal protein mrp2, mitochondrial, partial [Coemansia sp. RSA 1797]